MRADVPIFIGAEGPKNVTQTAEIADGWLPLYYSPYRQEVYADQIAGAKPGFEISAGAVVSINDNLEEALYPVKAKSVSSQAYSYYKPEIKGETLSQELSVSE